MAPKKRRETQTEMVNNTSDRGSNTSSVVSMPKSSPLDMTWDDLQNKTSVRKNQYEQRKTAIASAPKDIQNQDYAQNQMQYMTNDELSNLSNARRQRNDYYQNLDIADASGMTNDFDSVANALKKKYNLTDDQITNIVNEYDLQQRDKFGDEYTQRAERYAKEHPVLGSARSLGTKFGSSAFAIPQLIEDAQLSANGVRTGKYDGSHLYGATADSLREGASSDLGDKGKTAYQLGMGLGDMAIDATVGRAFGLSPAVFMAGNTADRSYREAIDKGQSSKKAVEYAAANGAVDYALSKFGLDQIAGTGKYFKQLGKQGTTRLGQAARGAIWEGAENGLQEYVRSGLDRAINKDKSDWQMAYDSVYNDAYANAYNELIAKGQTEDIAQRKAENSAKNEAKKYANSVIRTNAKNDAIVGGIFGAGFGALSYKPNTNPLGMQRISKADADTSTKVDASTDNVDTTTRVEADNRVPELGQNQVNAPKSDYNSRILSDDAFLDSEAKAIQKKWSDSGVKCRFGCYKGRFNQ